MISVAIPTTSRPELLERALDSISEGCEVIVVHDDPEAVVLYDEVYRRFPSVQRIVHDQNRGPSAARNTALRAATGDWVLYLDDDDHLVPGAIERMRAHAQSTQADVVAFGAAVCRPEGEVVTLPGPTVTKYGVPFWAELGSLLIRRDALEAVGGFDETMRIAENRDLTIRLAARFDFAQVADVVVVLDYSHELPRGSVDSGTTDANLRVLKKNADLFRSDPLWWRSMSLFVATHAARKRRVSVAVATYAQWAVGAGQLVDVRFLGSLVRSVMTGFSRQSRRASP